MKMKVCLLLMLSQACAAVLAQTVTDYDGNVYDTIMIGGQSWLKQNLKVTHYNDGTLIPDITDSSQWGGLTTGARCYYMNDSAAWDTAYGALYNWYCVNDSRKLCPAGWHVPANSEIVTLENLLGGEAYAGGALKEAGFAHWTPPNTGATNSTGFTGLPGGMRGISSAYEYKGENGLFWTSSQYNSSYSWSIYLYYLNAGVDHNPTPKYLGLSVRCLKDAASGTGGLIRENDFSVFPNPTRGLFTVQYRGKAGTCLTIYNYLGEHVFQTSLSQGDNQIDISSFPQGTYTLRITAYDQASGVMLIRQ